MNDCFRDLLSLLHDEEIIRLCRRAGLTGKTDLAKILDNEIIERDRKTFQISAEK